MVIASSWVPEEMTFYVITPNDIIRHSDLLKEKIKKKAQTVKEGMDKNISDLKRRRKNPSKAPTKKELGRMKFYDLLDNMTEDERMSADCLHQKVGDRNMVIPELNSSFSVKMKLNSDSKQWYLVCSCGFGNRYGGPCIHEFYIYKHYLCKLGVSDWNHHQVAIIHWAVWSYLNAKNEDELTEKECHELRRLQAVDPYKRFGTLCEIPTENNQSKIDWRNIISHDGDKCDSGGKSAQDWKNLDAVDRITNYTVDEARECLKIINEKADEVENSSQFETEISGINANEEKDRWENYGIDSEEDGNVLEARNSPDPSVLPQFQGMINNGRDTESRRSRKTDLSKLFHSTMMQTWMMVSFTNC